MERDSTRRGAALAGRINARCLQRGWSAAALARATGLSRTTVSQLLGGRSPRPHLKTLERIAAAFDIPLAELWHEGADERGQVGGPVEAGGAAESFDRRTNPAISEVGVESPHLFAGWSPAEWDELYSTFGEGGALTADGVRAAAGTINRRRETVRHTQILMETHLAEVTARLIETLYRMVRPVGNLEPSPQLDELVNRLRSERS